MILFYFFVCQIGKSLKISENHCNQVSSLMHKSQVLLTEFHCANCLDLIKLNPSLVAHDSLEEALGKSLNLTKDPLYLPVQEVLEVPAARIPPPRTLPGAPHLPESHTDSFVLLSRPPQVALPQSTLERNSLSHRLKIANKLFDFASGLSLVQHPLCQDCADELTIKLEKRLGAVKKERDAYGAYLESLQNQPVALEPKITQSEIEKVKILIFVLTKMTVGGTRARFIGDVGRIGSRKCAFGDRAEGSGKGARRSRGIGKKVCIYSCLFCESLA